MSIIHVNQIKSHVLKLFSSLIDLSDQNPKSSMYDDFTLTRSLAAYAVHFLSGAAPEIAAKSVTDGGNDNGIDAIYFDESSRRLYLVQAKWIKNGTGEPENGDVKKFLAGIGDLFNMQFDRFNARIQAMEPLLEKALEDPNTRYEIVLAYTGSGALAEPSRRDLDDLRREMNDTSEVLFQNILNQSALHASLVASAAGEPINLQIGVKEWGTRQVHTKRFMGKYLVIKLRIGGQNIAIGCSRETSAVPSAIRMSIPRFGSHWKTIPTPSGITIMVLRLSVSVQ